MPDPRLGGSTEICDNLTSTSGLRPWNAENAAVCYRDHCHLVAARHRYVAKLMQRWMQANLVV